MGAGGSTLSLPDPRRSIAAAHPIFSAIRGDPRQLRLVSVGALQLHSHRALRVFPMRTRSLLS